MSLHSAICYLDAGASVRKHGLSLLLDDLASTAGQYGGTGTTKVRSASSCSGTTHILCRWRCMVMMMMMNENRYRSVDPHHPSTCCCYAEPGWDWVWVFDLFIAVLQAFTTVSNQCTYAGLCSCRTLPGSPPMQLPHWESLTHQRSHWSKLRGRLAQAMQSMPFRLQTPAHRCAHSS